MTEYTKYRMISEYIDNKTNKLGKLVREESPCTFGSDWAKSSGMFEAYTQLLLRDILEAETLEQAKASADRILEQMDAKIMKLKTSLSSVA